MNISFQFHKIVWLQSNVYLHDQPVSFTYRQVNAGRSQQTNKQKQNKPKQKKKKHERKEST